MKSTFILNGQETCCDAPAGMTLMEFLRNDKCWSVKHGCDHGECGACTVLVNDRPMNACMLLLPLLVSKRVDTLEGLEASGEIRDLQQTFVDHGAIQCGFCTPGMLMVAAGMRRRKLEFSADNLRQEMAGVLCRCTGYVKPEEALKSCGGAQ